MVKRNTQTLFLRVDPEVARLVHRACEEWQVTQSQMGEVAIRYYLSVAANDDQRKNFLSGVEEALIARIDQRLANVLERIAGLYAKEAFDHAESLFLIKALVSMTVRDEKLTERYLGNARKDATDRLKNRAGPIADALARGREEVEQLKKDVAEARSGAEYQYGRAERLDKELADAKQKAAQLDSQVKQLKQQLDEQKRVHEFEQARDEWALQQYEAQGMLRRKSIQEWRAEYTKQHPAPRVG